MYQTTISFNTGFCYRCAVSQLGEANGQRKGRQLQAATEYLTVVIVVVVVVAVVAASIFYFNQTLQCNNIINLFGFSHIQIFVIYYNIQIYYYSYY